MLNWHFFASQFLCPYFSCPLLPAGIPFIPSSILEACSQIPFQTSFARLLSLPVWCGKTSSSPHYSSLFFSVLVPISVHLSWTGVSRVVVGIPAKVLLCNWNPASLCWKSLLRGHICVFMAMLHLNLQSSCGWVKLSTWWVPTFSLLCSSHLHSHEWGWGSVLGTALCSYPVLFSDQASATFPSTHCRGPCWLFSCMYTTLENIFFSWCT